MKSVSRNHLFGKTFKLLQFFIFRRTRRLWELLCSFQKKVPRSIISRLKCARARGRRKVLPSTFNSCSISWLIPFVFSCVHFHVPKYVYPASQSGKYIPRCTRMDGCMEWMEYVSFHIVPTMISDAKTKRPVHRYPRGYLYVCIPTYLPLPSNYFLPEIYQID